MLSITNGEFAWSKVAVSPILEDINLSIKKGELVGVMGRVGAGKVRGCIFRDVLATEQNVVAVEFALCNRGRDDPCRGRGDTIRVHLLRSTESMVSRPSDAAITASDVIARIMSATIKDNIVFNYEYDETFYNLVLDGAFDFVFHEIKS